MTDKTACIIGAGCSGFTTAKRLIDHNISYDCFEISDNVGGNWYYNNPNGMSSCYQTLHIDTSKHRLAFEDYPVPENWPDFPHHSQLFQYFQDYVDHFDLRKTITFNTGVKTAKRNSDHSWHVELTNGETRQYEYLIVANGHHWDAKIPTEYPGQFEGYQVHSHNYRDPYADFDMRNKNVMVVGMGNSAMDISSELSQRHLAKKLFVSARRGVWVLPKYLNGKVADKAAMPAIIPLGLQRKITQMLIPGRVGNMEDYGLPKPDHKVLEAHPSVSGEFLGRVGSGDIAMKPAIKSLKSDSVEFVDGTTEKLDAIIWATGYNVSFPFLADNELHPENNAISLFKRMVKPGWETLFFMGLAQPLPTLVNFAEQQSKLVAKAITGKYRLPSSEEMEKTIAKDDQIYTGHFYESERHTMQCDFNHYIRSLKKEVKKGERRAA